MDFICGGPLVKGRRQEKGRNSELRLLTFSPSLAEMSTSLVHPGAALPSMFMRGVFAQLVPFIFLCQYCTASQSVMLLVSCDETRREKSDTRTSIMRTTPFAFHKHYGPRVLMELWLNSQIGRFRSNNQQFSQLLLVQKRAFGPLYRARKNGLQNIFKKDPGRASQSR